MQALGTKLKAKTNKLHPIPQTDDISDLNMAQET